MTILVWLGSGLSKKGNSESLHLIQNQVQFQLGDEFRSLNDMGSHHPMLKQAQIVQELRSEVQ